MTWGIFVGGKLVEGGFFSRFWAEWARDDHWPGGVLRRMRNGEPVRRAA